VEALEADLAEEAEIEEIGAGEETEIILGCIMLYAVNAEADARFHSSQQEKSQSFAAIVLGRMRDRAIILDLEMQEKADNQRFLEVN